MDTTKIMVVDDDPGILFTVEAVLQDAGYDVTCCSSGKYCLQSLEGGFRGLVLMDIMMPEMDGWETVRRIVHEDLVEGNIISMLTAVGDPGAAGDPVADVVVDYVRKPFTGEELVALVREFAGYLPRSVLEPKAQSAE
jgi:CheY-like chemotaxis protein